MLRRERPRPRLLCTRAPKEARPEGSLKSRGRCGIAPCREALADIPFQFKAGREDTVSNKTCVCMLAPLTLITGARLGEDPAPFAASLEQTAADW